MGIDCLSCKKAVAQEEAQLFAEVFLCKDCHFIAKRLFSRGERELKMMLLLLKESIRVAALKGELQFYSGKVDDVPKEDLLTHLAKLAREQQESVCQSSKPQHTLSPVTTGPSAPTAGGKQ